MTQARRYEEPNAVEMLDRRSLAEKVFDRIKAGILSGDLKSGRRIVEEQIAVTLGVSLEANNVGVEFEADSRFHLEIARRSGNAALYETMRRLDGKVQLVRLMRCKKRENIARDLTVHEKIIRGIESGDGGAAACHAAQHVLRSGGNERSSPLRSHPPGRPPDAFVVRRGFEESIARGADRGCQGVEPARHRTDARRV